MATPGLVLFSVKQAGLEFRDDFCALALDYSMPPHPAPHSALLATLLSSPELEDTRVTDHPGFGLLLHSIM